jgi:hypothetical protein
VEITRLAPLLPSARSTRSAWSETAFIERSSGVFLSSASLV